MIVHAYYEEDSRVRREAESLVARGRPVDVFALRRPGDEPTGVVDGVRVHRLDVQRHQGAGLGVYLREYLASSRAGRLGGDRGPIGAAATRSSRSTRCRTSSSFAALPFRLAGVPLDPRPPRGDAGVLPDAASRGPRTRSSTGSCASRSGCRSRSPDAVITVNDALAARSWARRPAGQVTVVLNSPSLARFDPAAHPARPFMADGVLRLVYTGALTPTYEVASPSTRSAGSRRTGPSCPSCFDLYGRGDAEPALREQVERLGLGERVRFHGRIPIEDVPAAVAAADIGLAPTRRDPFTDFSASRRRSSSTARWASRSWRPRLPMVERTFPPGPSAAYAPGRRGGPRDRDPRRSWTTGWRASASVAATLEQVARAVLGARGREALGADRAARPARDVRPAPAPPGRRRRGCRRRIDAAVPRPIAGKGCRRRSAARPTTPASRPARPDSSICHLGVGATTAVAVIGLGYVGLPLALAFAEAGLDVVGVDASAAPGRRAPRGPLADRRRRRRPARGGARRRSAGRRRRPMRARRRGRDLRLRPDARSTTAKDPDLGPVLATGRLIARPRPARPADRPPVDDLPGHDHGSVPGGLEGTGLVAGTRLRPRLRAGARQPRRPGERRASVPRLVGGMTAGGHRARRGAAPPDQRPRGPELVLARRGGAREAARERVPQREHRARQPARPALRADGPRRLGGHRRRRDQAVRVHAVHGRARASVATASRSTRTTCRGGPASSTSSTASSSSPATSTSRCRATSSTSSPRRSTTAAGRSEGARSGSSAWPSSRTSATRGTRPRPR